MDTAIATTPDWVISSACRRAESIMDEGKAKYYYKAIEWLEKVRDLILPQTESKNGQNIALS